MVGIQRIFRVWEEAYGQHVKGRLDADIWDAMIRQYASYLSAPGFERVWKMRRNYYNASFRKFVDQLPRTEYSLQ